MSPIPRPVIVPISRGFWRPAVAAAVAAFIVFVGPVLSHAADSAQNAPNARGEKIFNTRCVFCHGVGLGHPGWQMLALKKGPAKAEILGRKDLTQAYVEQVVRDGNIEMPPFRPSEISNPDLKALAEYVIHPNGGATGK